MSITRRNFLKASAGGAAAIALSPTPACARDNLAMPPQALGLLFDSTLCVGCKACVTACKQANNIPFDTPVSQPHLDTSIDIGAKALNVIKKYQDGNGSVKDREKDGFAFAKKSCMHCVDPSCVSVCPVSAMQKDPITGIVGHYKENCIGCRYCVASCPFGIPRFEYDTPFPAISKCQLCQHLQAKGGIPACADACPTGATLFGPTRTLKEIAKQRLALKPGSEFRPERRKVGSEEMGRPYAAAQYKQHIYGDSELGGTQVLHIAAVPLEKLGMPVLPEKSYAANSETIQHGIYYGMAAPVAALAGLFAVISKNKQKNEGEEK